MFVLIYSLGYGQCNCETINREDGTNIKVCQIMPVAFDKQMQVGVVAATNGEDIFVNIGVRFMTTKRNKLTSDLALRLDDNSMISLKYFKSEMTYMGGSQIAQGVFLVNEKQLVKLKRYGIKTLSFKLNDGILRTFEAKINTDVLKKQLPCLLVK